MGLIFRVLLGYLVACFAAALTTVLFAWTPADLANMQGDLANDKLALSMPVATQIAIFAAPFALLAIALGEWQRWRDWAYYAAAGIAIALFGYLAQYQSERNIWAKYFTSMRLTEKRKLSQIFHRSCLIMTTSNNGCN